MATVQQSNSVDFAAINAANKAASTVTTTSAAQEQENRFLKLLTTQLKNQDPLNPMDNAQMTSQMAQMSTVSGIEKLNATLNSLVQSLGSSQAMQAAEMIGKSVLVSGTQLSLANGQAFGGVNLSSAADQVKLTIMDSTGKVIQSEYLGAHAAGSFSFAWDGKDDAGNAMTAGTYKFSVEATQGGNKVVAGPLQIGTVNALVRSTNGFLLDLGALGTVDFKNVQQIL